MSSPLVDFVQAQWRERRGPDTECVLLGEGTLHVMELLPPAVVQHLLTAEAWTAVNWINLEWLIVSRWSNPFAAACDRHRPGRREHGRRALACPDRTPARHAHLRGLESVRGRADVDHRGAGGARP